MRKILAFVLSMLWVAASYAQIVAPLPFTLQNGTIADANQVMSDLNAIVSAVNSNAASAGINTNITALNGLTTPLVYTSGGTNNYIGGTSGGSANAQTIASPIPAGFTLTTGKSVTFAPGFTNNGPATLNVAGTGATNVFKPGASGPVALSSQELTVGVLVTATFDGTQFQLTGVSPQSLVAPCTVIDWTGANAGPSGYLQLNGQTPLRSAFPTLFGCISVQGVAATTTSGSASVVVPNSALFQIGWSVGGNNVTCNSTVLTIPDGTHITISNNAGANGATTLTIGPYSQGDCSTTFAVGDYRGRATMMRDTGGAVLTATTCTNPATIGSGSTAFPCGAQVQVLTLAQTPAGITSAGTVNIPSQGTPYTAGGVLVTTALSYGGNNTALASVTSNSATFTSNNTGGNPHPILPPVALVDKYIKF